MGSGNQKSKSMLRKEVKSHVHTNELQAAEMAGCREKSRPGQKRPLGNSSRDPVQMPSKCYHMSPYHTEDRLVGSAIRKAVVAV